MTAKTSFFLINQPLLANGTKAGDRVLRLEFDIESAGYLVEAFSVFYKSLNLSITSAMCLLVLFAASIKSHYRRWLSTVSYLARVELRHNTLTGQRFLIGDVKQQTHGVEISSSFV